MKKVSFLFAMAVGLGLAQQASAFCQPGEVDTCYLNGQHGTRTCGSNGIYGPCVIPPPPPVPSGQVRPAYKVLTVVYAPPGKEGGGSTSSVLYANGSSMGTTSSSSDSFKQGYSVSVSATFGSLGATPGLLFGYNRSSTDTQSTEIKKSASSQISFSGPAVDGIDHNRDQIWLWLNPVVNVSLPTATSVEWQVDSTDIMDLQYVYVGHLRDPSLMPPGVASRLEAAGITEDDYAEILEANPFALGDTDIDLGRYVQLNTTFPYEPPYGPGDPVPTFSFDATYTSNNTTSSEVINEYTTGLTYEGEFGFTELISAKLKAESKWTWSDKTSFSNASGISERATVTVGGPAYGYTGPTDIAVYYDLLYKTFMFAPYEGSPLIEGAVYSQTGLQVGFKEITATDERGDRFRTFANADGKFRLFGEPSGRLTLRVDRVEVRIEDPSEWIEIALP